MAAPRVSENLLFAQVARIFGPRTAQKSLPFLLMTLMK